MPPPLVWLTTILVLAVLPCAAGAELLHQQVAACDEAGARVSAVLIGGQPLDGVLRGARVQIRSPHGRVLWDAFDSSLDPWLLRAGRFAGRNVLLIGVRKTAIFDPLERKRPFVYEIRSSDQGLRKIWLATSLSRPFETADFADLDGTGDDELVALEHTATGGMGLGAYIWKGFGVEGIARSADIAGATDIRGADVWGDDRHEVVVLTRDGTLFGFVAYELRGEELLPVAVARATVTVDGVDWSPVPRDHSGPGAVELRGKVTRRLPFRAATAASDDDSGTGWPG